jgi:hypothetical protein
VVGRRPVVHGREQVEVKLGAHPYLTTHSAGSSFGGPQAENETATPR